MRHDADVRFPDRTTPPHILTLVLMSGLSALSMSIILPSMPQMTRDLGTRYEVIQFMVSGFLAATAVMQLVIGPISDRYGRRIVTLVGFAIFAAASIGCAMAQSVEMLLAFRLLQCTAAVGMVLSRAIVRDLYAQDQAASMIGYVTMGMALAPMVAPSIGGMLDQAFGWRSVFVFTTASTIAVLVLCLFDLGETKSGGGVSFLKQARDYPELLSSRRFWGYAFASAFASGSFFAFLGGAPYVASTLYGLSPFWAGMCLGAPAIGYAFGNYLSGRLSVRLGVNRMIRNGAIVTASGLGIAITLTVLGLDSPFVFFGFCPLIGVGNGMVIPNASAGMLSVRPHLAGSASGIGGAFMIGGGAALSVFAGILVQDSTSSAPLLAMMLTSVLLGVASIQYVVWRERQLDSAAS